MKEWSFSPVPLLAGVAATVLAVLPVAAQNVAPIETRQELMESNGDGAKAASAMLKGEAPFDAAKAAEILERMNEVAQDFGNHFPEDSKAGNDTEAAPAIWERPEEFEATLAAFREDTAAAVAANPQTLEEFEQAFGAVAENCRSCHEEFRIDDD